MINYRDENLGQIKKIFKGELLYLPIYNFKISELKFNPHNTRVIDVIESKYGSDIFERDEIYSDEIQNIILTSLRKTHDDETNKILLSSINKGITEPFAITEDGYVLSGNNRLAMIKANIGKEGFNFNENSYIEGVLIKGKLSVKDFNDWELSFQNEADIKKEYEQMNVILKTKMLREKGTTISEILKITKYKNESAIIEAIGIESLYRELLFYAGVPNAVDLHRNIAMYSSLHALYTYKINKQISNDLKRLLQNIYFKIILSTNIPVLKLRSELFALFISKNELSTIQKNEILEEIEEKIEEKINDTFKLNKQNKFDESSIKLIDYSKDENGIKTLFNELAFETRIRVKEILSIKNDSPISIGKKINQASKNIEYVSELPNSWFENLDIEDENKIYKEVNNLEDQIQKIKNKLKK